MKNLSERLGSLVGTMIIAAVTLLVGLGLMAIVILAFRAVILMGRWMTS